MKPKMTTKEAEDKIRGLLDDDFLSRLLEIGRLYGWKGDYIEIASFIEDLHRFHEIDKIDTTIYDVWDDEGGDFAYIDIEIK